MLAPTPAESGPLSVAGLPVVRPSVLVSNGHDRCQLTVYVIPDGVWKLVKNVKMEPVIVRRPHVSPHVQSVDRLKHLCAEGVRGYRTTFKVPKEGFTELPFSLG